jgi:hypothetical protein
MRASEVGAGRSADPRRWACVALMVRAPGVPALRDHVLLVDPAGIDAVHAAV